MDLDRLAARLAGSPPRSVCLIKPSSLGDVVHALPTLHALKRLWPEARFSWVISEGLRGLVAGHPDLEDVVPFDRGATRRGPSGWLALVRWSRELRRREFDLTIDLQGLLRSGLMALATGARVRVGPADAREGATRFYTHTVRSDRPHAVDRALDVAKALGADVSEPVFRLAVGPEDHQRAAERLSGLPRPWVAYNLGARWLTKRWPPGHFAELARRATDQGAGTVVVGAPEDRPLADAFLGELGEGVPFVDLCGKTNLRELAAVCGQLDLFVSNDTGPLHLAAASGTPVVGIYTCTSPERTGPYGPNALAVSTRVWCKASRLRTCGRLECMAELSPARVWPHLAAGLDKGRCRTGPLGDTIVGD